MKRYIVVFLFTILSFTAQGADLEEFTAAGAENRININPASLANLTRFQLQYEGYTGDTSPFASPTYTVVDTSSEEGSATVNELIFGWPTFFTEALSFGIKYETAQEEFKSTNLGDIGVNAEPETEVEGVSNVIITPDLTLTRKKSEFSFLFAYNFEFLVLGISVNYSTMLIGADGTISSSNDFNELSFPPQTRSVWKKKCRP